MIFYGAEVGVYWRWKAEYGMKTIRRSCHLVGMQHVHPALRGFPTLACALLEWPLRHSARSWRGPAGLDSSWYPLLVYSLKYHTHPACYRYPNFTPLIYTIFYKFCHLRLARQVLTRPFLCHHASRITLKKFFTHRVVSSVYYA